MSNLMDYVQNHRRLFRILMSTNLQNQINEDHNQEVRHIHFINIMTI